jgi:hypothetical protein
VRRRAPLLPSLSRSSICANHKGNRSRYHVIDGTRQCMSSNSEGLARTVFVLESDEAFRPSGMISQAEDGRFRRGPLELGMAHFGAGAARALAVRCLGARDQTTGGGTRLDPREAAEVVDFVEQYETENRADAWYGLPQRQGVLVMLGGGFEDGQFHVAEQFCVVVSQGMVDCDTLRHGGLGTPLSDTIAVRLLGDLLAACGQVRLASGMLDVGYPLRPCAHQMQAVPEEISRGPHLGRVRLGRFQARLSGMWYSIRYAHTTRCATAHDGRAPHPRRRPPLGRGLYGASRSDMAGPCPRASTPPPSRAPCVATTQRSAMPFMPSSNGA